jgi:hypothetical protein
MANAPHFAVRRAEYAADLGENGSGIFLILRNLRLDATSENQNDLPVGQVFRVT